MGLSEEQADLLDAAERFCREKSPAQKVRKLLEDEQGFDPGLWDEIASLGWLAIAIPEEYGGLGLSLAEVAPVMEQMGRFLLASPFAAATLGSQAILKGGTQEHKKALLPQIAQGAVATLALAEPHGGWTVDAFETRATRDGDGFVLSGVKRFVADAMSAQWIVVAAQLDDGPALFVLEASAIEPAAFRREIIIDETKRTYELSLDRVRVPGNGLLDPAKARETLAHIHLAANLLAAAEMAGGARAVIDYTIDYLNTRKQFGKPIGAYQALKHPTVDAYVQYEQARSHVYAAAHSFNQQGAGEAAVRMAKAAAETALSYAADRAIQFHGGFGFTYECDAGLYRRRALWHASQYGDAAWQRKKLAELLL